MARREKPQKGRILEESAMVRLTEEQANQLSRLAFFHDMSQPQLMRRLIDKEWQLCKLQVLAVERARLRTRGD